MDTKHLLLAGAAALLAASEALADYAQHLGDEPAPKKTAPKKAAPKDEDDEPAPKKTAAKKPAADEDDGDDGALVYEDDIRPHVVKLSKDHGRDAALDVVSQFEDADGNPCEHAKNVQPEDWPELLKKIKAKQKKLDREKADADD